MYIYCVYPAISKSPKPLPKCLKIAKTSVVLIGFNGAICEARAYTVSVSVSEILYEVHDLITDIYLTNFISTQKHTVAG
jgi:hypothetical protein